jgi:uncharacterized protein
MNKPAPKEPSMDEILSSIRQIIADDDAGAVAPKRPVVAAAIAPRPIPVPAAIAPEPVAAAIPQPISWDALPEAVEDDLEPLALSPEQIVPAEPEPVPEAAAPFSFDEFMKDAKPEEVEAPVDFVDPDDISFDLEVEPEAEPEVEDVMAAFAEVEPEPLVAFEMPVEPEPDVPDFSAMLAAAPLPEPEPEPVPVPEPRFTPRQEAVVPPVERNPFPRPTPTFAPRASVAEAAPMPDPTLSADIAEQLLEPATNEAVRSTFAKLNQIQVAAPGLTIDTMIRDMLRPMLKEWLDENLPSMVERMVEKEIARISRGE